MDAVTLSRVCGLARDRFRDFLSAHGIRGPKGAKNSGNPWSPRGECSKGNGLSFRKKVLPMALRVTERF